MPALRALTVFVILASPLSAQTLRYRTYVVETDSTLWRSAIGVPDADAAISQVVWRSESGDSHRELHRVQKDGNTLGWAVTFPEEETDYVGQRRGDSVFVRGVIDGRVTDAGFEIDEDPLFINVALGLATFVRSGLAEVDFWTIRPGDDSMVHMDAKREAVDTLVIAGVPTPAARLRWAPKGWRGFFYSRRFWFRTTDGVLLQTDEDEGRATSLVGVG